MSKNGAGDLLVQARSVLLDALTALSDHRDSVVVIGAQAIYLHTGAAEVALAEATKDSDLALDSRSLGSDPLIEAAMTGANFILNPDPGQPGSWINPQGIPVDLMVPEAIAGPSSRRRADIPPHSREATRRAVGLEAAVVDHAEMEIRSLSAADPRVLHAQVAGPAALLVAKLHKLGERQASPTRLVDKDAPSTDSSWQSRPSLGRCNSQIVERRFGRPSDHSSSGLSRGSLRRWRDSYRVSHGRPGGRRRR